MPEIDAIFTDLLKQKIPKNISVTEEIAEALGINYDAAYRRLNNKVSFNLTEIVLLSKKYDISLNNLYEVGEENSYIVKSTYTIQDVADFTTYLSNLKKELQSLHSKKEAAIIFSARELPMFYFFKQPILIHFKIFIWFTILKVTHVNKRIRFNDFVISDKIISLAQETHRIYNQINITEMWSFGALNNVLKQLLYLYEMGQINMEDATKICDALVMELKNVEIKTRTGLQSEKSSFTLYSNELFMMNNSFILKSKNQLRFAYPYALLKYFIINNQKACREQENYIKKQMQHTINISETSTKEHAQFFNFKYEKIKQALRVMKHEEQKPPFL